jgi:hypothetical protein
MKINELMDSQKQPGAGDITLIYKSMANRIPSVHKISIVHGTLFYVINGAMD